MKRVKQTDIAKILNISIPYLSLLLKGSRKMSWSLAKNISRYTGVDPGRIMDASPSELRDFLNLRKSGGNGKDVLNVPGENTTRERGNNVTVEN